MNDEYLFANRDDSEIAWAFSVTLYRLDIGDAHIGFTQWDNGQSTARIYKQDIMGHYV